MRPTEENPHHFFNGFRASASYVSAYANFFRDKRLVADVTDEEMREAFEQSDAAKVALISFARDDTAFGFNPDHYAPATLAALTDYIAYVRWTFQRMTEQPDRAEIVEMDTRRSQLHRAVAQALIAEGIVPNETLGRALARLALVSLGLDNYASALETQLARIERVYRGHP